jgi:glycosyltransferase involved in cell wall biosynthesis
VLLLSVVIASIGRPSLWATIDSIISDLANLDSEIIVVLDNPNFDLTSGVKTRYSNVQFIHPKVQLGAAGAYDLGLNTANGRFIRIFSDDDIWVKGSALALLEAASEDLITAGATNLRDELGFAKRSFPREVNTLGVIGSLYQIILPWKRNPNYLTLTSMLLPRKVLEVPFASNFKTKEDIVWLQKLWESGERFKSIDTVVSEVEISLERSTNRNTLTQESDFVDFTWARSRRIARRYLFQHSGRAAAAMGNHKYFSDCLKISHNKKIYPSLIDFLIFKTLVAISIVQKLRLSKFT